MIIKTAPIAKHIINSSSVNQMRYLWPCDLELREVEGSFCISPVVDGARSLSSRSDSLPKYGLMLFSSAIREDDVALDLLFSLAIQERMMWR